MQKVLFLRLAEELGLNNPNPGNDTYCFSQESEVDIIDRTKNDLLSFRITPDQNQGKLALLYQTPKFHKNPPKMRYIAGNINTVNSKLDRILAMVLKMCKCHFKNLCNKNFEFSGIRYFFDVQTSSEVKEMFDKAQGQADMISINDFSTLYLTVCFSPHMLKSQVPNCFWLFLYLY